MHRHGHSHIPCRQAYRMSRLHSRVQAAWRGTAQRQGRQPVGTIQAIRRRGRRGMQQHRGAGDGSLRPPSRSGGAHTAHFHRPADDHTAIPPARHAHLSGCHVSDKQRVPLLDRVRHRHPVAAQEAHTARRTGGVLRHRQHHTARQSRPCHALLLPRMRHRTAHEAFVRKPFRRRHTSHAVLQFHHSVRPWRRLHLRDIQRPA